MPITRWRAASAAFCSAALLAAGLGAPAHAKRVRVFAMGPKFDLRWVESRDTYRAKMLALFDASKRDGTVPIQARAADARQDLLGPADPKDPVGTARDLVAWPEDVGIFAVLTGPRGAAARRADSLTNAIAAVLASYGDHVAYYQARFPELAERPPPPTRALFIAATDTFARVAVETFAEIADTYDVYLEAGVNMAREWRVVCVSKSAYQPPPGAGECEVENPALVARLRGPEEPQRDYAYEATTPDAHNMALLFDPSGRIINKTVKAYPTPTEAPGLLDLKPGKVSGVDVVDTPVGRLGFVTSRDAFMPDVTHKLDQRRVEILVQPEFFVNDIVRTEGMWAPDTLKSSGFSALQRLPSIEALVLPEMTGNVYEFDADAQSHIAIKPRSPQTPLGGLVGQPAEPGFVQVAPWVVRDPARPDEPFEERRQRLGKAGEAVAPGSGVACDKPDEPGPCEGGQVEGVLYQDVQVGVTPGHRPQRRRPVRRTKFTTSRPIAPSPNPQRNVALASRGRDVWAAYEERRDGRDAILFTRSRDGGATWRRPVRPVGETPEHQWWPSLSVGPDGVLYLAWQQGGRVKVARSTDSGRTFVPVLADFAEPTVFPLPLQWKPSIAATGKGTAFLAWVDEGAQFGSERDLPRSELRGARVEGSRMAQPERLDGGQTAELARTQDHAWAPAVAATRTRLAVAWADVRTYDWRIYTRESTDGGTTFGDERAVQDTPPVKTDPILPPVNEALNQDPAAAVGSGGALVAWTDFRKSAESARRPHSLYDIHLAGPGGRDVQVDPHGAAQQNTFFPAVLADRRDALVAWQDHAGGPADIFVARMRGGTRRGRAYRVDDSGSRPWNQWRPRLVRLRGERVLAAWEDERDGPPQIFAARAAIRALR